MVVAARCGAATTDIDESNGGAVTYLTTSTEMMPAGSIGRSERSVGSASSLSTTALDSSSATSPKIV